MSQPDPRAVAKGIISGWYQSTEAAAGFTLGIAEHEWQRLEAIIAAVLADAERRGMERAAKKLKSFNCYDIKERAEYRVVRLDDLLAALQQGGKK